jgi:peptide/nickel transport system substrate-binding protein
MEELSYWQRLERAQLRRRTLLATALGTGPGALALAACGQARTTSTAKSGAAASSGTPQRGGVVVHRLNTDPSPLDVHGTSTFYAVWPETPCYNQLVQYDPQDPDNKIIPDLADSYEIAGDGKSIVFKLHPGVKFHDGSDFSSEDVKANLDWIQNPPPKKVSPRQGALDAIDRVETPDPLTAKIVLKRPNPSLIANLASEYLDIGAKVDLDKGDLGTQMNGTGPFMLKSFTRGVGVELERNPNYWVKDRPYLDGLKYLLVADDTTAFANFLGGQFSRYYPVLPEDMDRVARETGGKATAYSPLGLSRDIVFFNSPKKPFDDIRVRQAVSMALDRQEGIQVVRGGRARASGYMLPGGDWAIPDDQRKKIPGYDKADIAEAKKLLAAAGVTQPLSGVVLTRTDVTFRNQATWVQGALQKALGWNLTIDAVDNASAYAKAYAGQFDLISWTVAITVDDPDATFAEIATSKAVRNWSKVYDTDADALFDKQTQTVDPTQRKPIVQQMETKFLNDFQVVLLDFQNANHAIYNSLQNYKLSKSLYTNYRYQDAWLAKG